MLAATRSPVPSKVPLVRDIVVFSGSAHPELARQICDELGVPLSGVDVVRFSNDCLQVQLLENCRQKDVYLVQPLVPPTQEHLFELLLMINAARGASAASVTAVMPHFAYARSDKKDASRISFGGRMVADLIQTAGAHRVLTMTLHAPQVHGFFSVPVDHLTATGVLADHFRERDLSNHVVVSPDFGNAKTASLLARLLGLPVDGGGVLDDQPAAGQPLRDVQARAVRLADLGEVHRLLVDEHRHHLVGHRGTGRDRDGQGDIDRPSELGVDVGGDLSLHHSMVPTSAPGYSGIVGPLVER